MDTQDNDEPTELELEQQRAGLSPAREDDPFVWLQATSWLGGIDELHAEVAPPTSDYEPIPDPDAERAAEHQRTVTGRPVVRFFPDNLHRPADEDNNP